jgi:hypothetical protein
MPQLQRGTKDVPKIKTVSYSIGVDGSLLAVYTSRQIWDLEGCDARFMQGTQLRESGLWCATGQGHSTTARVSRCPLYRKEHPQANQHTATHSDIDQYNCHAYTYTLHTAR